MLPSFENLTESQLIANVSQFRAAGFSEPEAANAKWIFDNFPNVRYFMDLHSSGEDILYTWGDDENQTVNPLALTR